MARYLTKKIKSFFLFIIISLVVKDLGIKFTEPYFSEIKYKYSCQTNLNSEDKLVLGCKHFLKDIDIDFILLVKGIPQQALLEVYYNRNVLNDLACKTSLQKSLKLIKNIGEKRSKLLSSYLQPYCLSNL